MLELYPRYGVSAPYLSGAFAHPGCPRAVTLILNLDFNPGPPLCGPQRILLALAMTLDAEEFLHHLEDIDLPLAKKVEIIHSVAAIMQSGVDRAWGVHSTQLCPARTRLADSRESVAEVDLEDQSLKSTFDRATEGDALQKKR